MKLLTLITLLGLASCNNTPSGQDLRVEQGEIVYVTQKLYFIQDGDLYERPTPMYKYYCKKLKLTKLRAFKLNSDLNGKYEYGGGDTVFTERGEKEFKLIRIYNDLEGIDTALVDFVTTSDCETKSDKLLEIAENELRGLE